MESTEEERKIFKSFLESYCQSDACSTENDSLPFRHETTYVTEAEIDAECLDFCIQYLSLKECPPRLLMHLARSVTESVCSQDHHTLHWTPPAAENEESNSSSDTILIEENKVAQKEATPVIEKDKLVQVVKREIGNICQQWRTELPSLAHYDPTPLMSAHAVRNTRRKMEDRHVVLPHVQHLYPNPHEGNYHYYAVFDGHGGVEAAVYAAAHLHCHLVKNPVFPNDLSNALRDAFISTDNSFVQKAKRESLRSGSTGVCAVLSDSHLHVGWLGDSQALLVRGGTPLKIMDPHKPERMDERKRIEDLGGCVVWYGAWRVNGTLSVSRAIGDADYKPYVSGEPDVCSVELTGDEDYVVLACDGLWDTVTPGDLVRHVYEHLRHEGRATLARSLVQLAQEQGSTDNISVIVILLRDDVAPPNIVETPAAEGPFKFGDADGESEDEDEEKEEEEEEGGKKEDDKKEESSEGKASGESKVDVEKREESDSEETADEDPVDKCSTAEIRTPRAGKICCVPLQESAASDGALVREFILHQSCGGQHSPSEVTEASDNTPDVRLDSQFSSGDSVKSALGITALPSDSPPTQKIVAPLALPEDIDTEDDRSSRSQDPTPPLPGPVKAQDVRIDEIVLEAPPPASFSPKSRSVKSAKESSKGEGSEKRSGVSQGELAVLSHTANKCVHARRGRRGRNGHRRNHKENRRSSKGPPAAASPLPSALSPRRREATTTPRPRNKAPDLVHMLTGVAAHKPTQRNRDTWTVAVEIELGAALFEDPKD